jgi:hypothetical protein
MFWGTSTGNIEVEFGYMLEYPSISYCIEPTLPGDLIW